MGKRCLLIIIIIIRVAIPLAQRIGGIAQFNAILEFHIVCVAGRQQLGLVRMSQYDHFVAVVVNGGRVIDKLVLTSSFHRAGELSLGQGILICICVDTNGLTHVSHT